jgi:serine/threonine protein phosphatase PrpC
MKLIVANRSDRGPVRAKNEDVAASWEASSIDELRKRGAVAIIADGVGGHGGGDIAAQLAVESALDVFKTCKPGSLNSMLSQMINRANLAVYDAGMNAPSTESRMQTTLTAVIFRNDQIAVGHVGDCRTYLIHDGIARCLTADHTAIPFGQKIGLYESQIRTSSPLRGGLTRSIGNQPIVAIDFATANVYAGDYVVQCTDGVHVFFTEHELAETVTHLPPLEACDALLKLAVTRGTEDNITIQIIKIERIQAVGYYRGSPIYRETAPMGHELEAGDVLDGRFEILDVISRSGMATIFKALDRQTGIPIALKVPFMQYENDPGFFSRFQREEKISLSLDHPSILKVVPVEASAKSRPYIAMELLSGQTLDQIMQVERPMDVPKAIKIVADICDALAHMHERNIVHRDLKPANIMVCDDGSLRIIDFGIAKAAGMRRITFTGFSTAMGTPDYMAPEQVKGRRGDQRTDIYSLGAILYEMVTGHTPFEGQNPFLIMQARVTGDPEAPSNFNSEISPQLEEIILHALEREPRNRYASAAEMQRDLLEPANVELTGRVDRLKAPALWKARWRSARMFLLFLLFPLVTVLILYFLSRGNHATNTLAPPVKSRHAAH